jgi:hypothetical protein
VSHDSSLDLEGSVEFGVTQMLIGSGVFMLVTAVALGGTGLALRRRI